MAVNRTSKAKGKVVDIPANAPTIGTPTDAGDGTTANVAFTAPSTSTGGPIFSYTATSNPGSFTGTGTSTSTVAVTGLTAGQTITITAKTPITIPNTVKTERNLADAIEIKAFLIFCQIISYPLVIFYRLLL